MNVYVNCPAFESKNFKLRKVCLEVTITAI